jgi:hypothetical protein
MTLCDPGINTTLLIRRPIHERPEWETHDPVLTGMIRRLLAEPERYMGAVRGRLWTVKLP